MEEERERKQQAMKRYLLYNEKFEFHENAKKTDAELRTNAVARIKCLQENFTKPEVQFIENALNELVEVCTPFLIFIYIYFCLFLFIDINNIL